jgi:mono/diheme cytochrome c family protein
MKKLLKVVGILVLSILLIVLLGIAYIKIILPDVGPAPQLTVERTSARLARGSYLANSVMVCMDCHSIRNPALFSLPMDEATRGGGGQRFDQSMGFPGIFYSANITPFGIGSWTDGEIYRAITTGVRKNGKPIFPVMPYHSYGHAAPEDVKSLIVYLRSLSSKENVVPLSSADFPMNILLNTVPKKADPMTVPPAGDSLAYGRYLFTIASCYDCHTPFDKGKFDDRFAFAGGRSFPVPGGIVTSANITTDKETGLGSWTRDLFIRRFTFYRDSANAHRVVNHGELQTIMPWTMYGTMTDSDLSSIYTYMQTIKPIKHVVVKFKAD